MAWGEASRVASRIELYQASRCISAFLPGRLAMGATETLWREEASPPRKPRVWALKKWLCWADTLAPSLLLMRRLVWSAAASHSSARRAASSLVMGQGGNRARSRWLAGGAVSASSGRAGIRASGGEGGDGVGGLHGLLYGPGGKVRGAGLAAPVGHVDRHAQRFVAVALDVFQFTFAHADRQAATLGGFGCGIGGAELFGMGQGAVYQLFKKWAAVTEAAVGAMLGAMRWRSGRRAGGVVGGWVHGGRYDTCRCAAPFLRPFPCAPGVRFLRVFLRAVPPFSLPPSDVTQTPKRLFRQGPVRCRRQRAGRSVQGRTQRPARRQPHRSEARKRWPASAGQGVAGPARRFVRCVGFG